VLQLRYCISLHHSMLWLEVHRSCSLLPTHFFGTTSAPLLHLHVSPMYEGAAWLYHPHYGCLLGRVTNLLCGFPRVNASKGCTKCIGAAIDPYTAVLSPRYSVGKRVHSIAKSEDQRPLRGSFALRVPAHPLCLGGAPPTYLHQARFGFFHLCSKIV
jgi:hypothetical protein